MKVEITCKYIDNDNTESFSIVVDAQKNFGYSSVLPTFPAIESFYKALLRGIEDLDGWNTINGSMGDN